MNIKVRRKRIFIVITCTLSTLLIAIISATPMYLHKCEVMPVADRCPEPTFNALLGAIEWVESKGDANAIGDNGRAVGAYQIHKIYVDDVNRIIGKNKYTYEDRWDKEKSREMVRIYLLWYSGLMRGIFDTKDMVRMEMMGRIHNGGPRGWLKESTKPYWEKVKARLGSR